MKFIITENMRAQTVALNPNQIVMLKADYYDNCKSTIVYTTDGSITVAETYENLLSELAKLTKED